MKAKIVPFKDKRWQIIDESGKTLDDAQGYGFKTYEGAEKCWRFKQKVGYSPKDIKAFKKKVRDWWDKHSDIDDLLTDECFSAMKDGEHLTKADLVKIFDKHMEGKELDLPEGIQKWQLLYYR